jgi:restriction endonuclease S subunit
MRLRPNRDEVVPEYLVHYLNSPDVQMWITFNSRASTAIPHISTAALRELMVPIPPLAVQREIAATMDLVDVHVEQYQYGVSTVQSLRELVFPSLMRS